MTTFDPALARALHDSLGAAVRTASIVHGGDVAEAYRVDLADGRRVFAKTHRRAPPGFFTTEAAGLSWLRKAGTVAVPEVLAVSDGNGDGSHDDGGGEPSPPFLALEWIEEGPPSATTDTDLGRDLAELHLAGAPCFGREDRRTTGSRRLPNEPMSTWVEFYGGQRLRPLARMAAEAGALPASTVAGLEQVADRLAELGGPPEPPARLHGDLWAGNRLVDGHGRSWLIDPACHGGHREFDLAMMRLFGGFGPGCFAAYEELHPLSPGWEDRVALHQLAPLAVHAVKFGGGYVGATAQAVMATLGR